MSDFLSHPDKPYIDHIKRMVDISDSKLEKEVKAFHDVAKLKSTFQKYIQNLDVFVENKNHALLSAYMFLENCVNDELDTVFGFLAIVLHHKEICDLDDINDYFCLNEKELSFANEVLQNAKTLDIYQNISFSKDDLSSKTKNLERFLMNRKFRHKFDYDDFVNFKGLFSNLIYSDKYEAIFSSEKIKSKNVDIALLENYIANLSPHKKRDEFRKFVLNNFDENHRLFTLTAPTGYGKTLTVLNYALKFNKSRIIFTLPFTTIIDQTYDIISEIYSSQNSVFKIHHKTTINENVDEDRYSEIKFLMNSFSADINVTTLYQLIFAMFGNSNKDNVKFNQLKNSVIIIDEAQAIPYTLRKDFIKLCEIISQRFDSVFIFMSATMPIISGGKFKEISNLDYFKDQKRYDICWLELENEAALYESISKSAMKNHTLVVVNTVEKAQELFYKFKSDFKTYSLTSYMSDEHKQKTISCIQNKLTKNDEKILLISTQSIEAGVDVSFEVGFREVAPISSIIQTAGRINRHFGDKKGKLYVFDDISGHTDDIYGDLKMISDPIISDMLKKSDICESEVLEFSNAYFEKIYTNLESYILEKDMQNLKFASTNKKISEIMNVENGKTMLVIEPYDGFVDGLKTKFSEIKNQKTDKFNQMNKIDKLIIKELIKHSINISKSDQEKIKSINLKDVNFIHDVKFLPFNAREYNDEVGFNKLFIDEIFS
ncbi:CRISPR/Cas system-associated endonuclease/helicase Cas3, type I-B/HMARI [Campylobacter iguaniorum]|uniref:CRISPR/Cas system-associated endonuclease/helicase Cas3, type I-B/HMARI n=1 Tax=Campylobacter iguaniorum TaxID=1244531 RepID=A0A076FAF4_9BACT|nr:CRISPR-associated helicase Cas3' [Campylobacter iguaniorum]AII14452.1 CRISPR/Cas system-associated endonuclease/helicase Cas3, type I-B/HMARI [Campylobacter iguaniorum]ALV24187.1 CRISPR/Cas system-associated endonuclease/helicase Cas3, type I-B/HMARI [Campylobacter iguaniorum]